MTRPGDAWRDELRDALATPCATSWSVVVGTGNRLLRREGPLAEAERWDFLAALRTRLRSWPPELCRKCPPDWPEAWRKVAERAVREVDTYGRYVDGVGADPRLRRANGRQAVKLRRRFVGAVQTLGGRRMKVGEPGEPDLQGRMVLDLPGGVLAVSVAVEVKEPGGSLEPVQETWRDVALDDGVLWICVTTVEEAVLLLVEARRALTRRFGGTA